MKPILATFIRRLELQGQNWDSEVVVDVLRAVDVLGGLADGSLGLKWLALSLIGLEIDGVRRIELEDVLVRMQGLNSFEFYCPGKLRALVQHVEAWQTSKLISSLRFFDASSDLRAISLPRILNSWSGSLRCVGL